jgi:DNA processing protein
MSPPDPADQHSGTGQRSGTVRQGGIGQHSAGGWHSVGGLLRLLVEDDRLARATWSRLAEPGDVRAAKLVAQWGPGAALDHLAASTQRAHEPYQARLRALDPRPALDLLDRLGGRLVCPGDEEWPSGFALLPEPPFCLWVRGPLALDQSCERSVSIVGSRASTNYGNEVAGLLADGVAERGFTVVSGAAYGIDGSAHIAALRAEGRTIAVLAGGIDRAYPRAHERLLAEIIASGAAMSEVPPGSASLKNRFLQRNRMIATMTCGTVVVEAAARSGALNTARLAAQHGRPVGAVPGPVTSDVSAGCHQALREGYAVAVTNAAEVAELVGRIGDDLAPRPQGVTREDWDDLDEVSRRVLDALPKTRGSAVDRIALVAGLSPDAVRSVLGRLALLALAEREGSGWRRTPVPRAERERAERERAGR